MRGLDEMMEERCVLCGEASGESHPLYSGGNICASCLDKSIYRRCIWCGVVIAPGEEIGVNECPSCGQPVP